MMKISRILFLIVTALVVVTTSCSDDDESAKPKDIVSIASSDPQFSTLVAALTKANLAGVLQGNGPFTVFAPTNTAFNTLLSDLGVSSLNDLSAEALTPILLNHVVSGSFRSTDLTTGYVKTANTGGPNDTAIDLYVEAGSGVKLNKTINVTTANIEASNGIIHVIDKVILPTDVVDIAVNNDNFTSLVGALGAASGDLVTALKGNGPFTVFAPVNAAFTDIADVTAELTDDQLADVLKYHVVAGANVLSADLTNGMEVTTLSGTFTVNISGSTVTITDQSGATAQVIATNVQGTNGVVHVIDKVLLK
ncbi:MAG TPA: fasciclin domain-containing protein [Cyclobacteriaceae bacterium]|nr:fasciclin domain-containing protein [Cyclobacteriaceae bacterium]